MRPLMGNWSRRARSVMAASVGAVVVTSGATPACTVTSVAVVPILRTASTRGGFAGLEQELALERLHPRAPRSPPGTAR